MDHDVIIIGGGAAGLYCAAVAGRRGRRVLVLEHQSRPGSKILISGGGRCNFTNLGAGADNYVTAGSPHFLKSALARCTPQDVLAWIERNGIAWHERKHRQLFCDHSSKQILHQLEVDCAEAGVALRLNCRVLRRTDDQGWRVDRVGSSENPAGHRFELTTNAGVFTASSLVIATGGLSFPRLGATPFGFEMAQQFGVPLIPRRPGLVPFTWSPSDRDQFAGLSGIAFECVTSLPAGGPTFREAVLFTHRGLSGPAILQISSYWRAGTPVCLNLLPDQSAADLLAANRAGGRTVKAALRQVLPERFVQAWCERHAPAKPIAQLSRRELERLSQDLHAWEIVPAGDEGYLKAEVTVGGVDTRGLSSKTLECRDVPGLFFIGEVVDVTGWLGGFNFQWAWASANAAGHAV
ncbi:MAG: NAD(P)/FAD-dependent oxidoreductase [Verrucomicrobiales bacterium]|nr:NAD(P)/FAD-dependent oxidoreductase [Verrucomicrobiales bacterium]